ncbi:MAG: nucleotidyltransferase family protein [Vicinamibacterales bacterium]
MIPALVLTAGLATRLRPLSHVRAKAALPVAGRPLVHRIISRLEAAGVRDLVLNLHHLPHTITRVVGDGAHLGVRVRYSWESPVLGSAGGPRRALPLLDAPRFLVVNGDTLTDVAVEAVVRDHERSGALVTMAVVPNADPDKYGGVLVDEGGVVTGFTRRGSPPPSYHFIGVQVAQADAFAGVPDEARRDSVGALYPELMRDRPGSIRAHISRAAFLDIGTPADYLDTCVRLAAREGQPLPRGTVLWDDVVVEPGARLQDCVVTDGVRVPARADWSGVTVRIAGDHLEPFERREEGLAIGPIARGTGRAR